MTKTEAMNILIDRYDCDISDLCGSTRAYHKNIVVDITFEEDIQKWGMGTIWIGNKQIWSTGEFRERRKLTMEQLFNVLDNYLPIREQMRLF